MTDISLSSELEAPQTRRKVLKRAGIVGAGALGAPLIFATGADAANPRKRCVADAEGGFGAGCLSSCQGLNTQCSADGTCYCTVDVNGCCACIAIDETFGCGSQPCNSPKDCPRGFSCVSAPCCANGAKGICIHTCKSAASAGAATIGHVVRLGG